MILVTGATGTIGGLVLRTLVERGVALRAMTRRPEALSWAAGRDVDVVRADFADAESLRRAVAGAERVFLLTAPGAWVPEHDGALLEAARAADVRKVVKLSAIGTVTASPAPDEAPAPSDWHAPGERALADGPWTWSVLRPSSFASNALRWAPAVRAGRPVPNTTGSGTQGVVDPRDVAEVAAEALLTSRLDGVTSTLTGPAALSVPDQVAALGAVLGRPLETVDVPPDAARRQMRAAGLHSSVVEVAQRANRMIAEQGYSELTDDVARVLGRLPRTFADWCRDHGDAFRAPTPPHAAP